MLGAWMGDKAGKKIKHKTLPSKTFCSEGEKCGQEGGHLYSCIREFTYLLVYLISKTTLGAKKGEDCCA